MGAILAANVTTSGHQQDSDLCSSYSIHLLARGIAGKGKGGFGGDCSAAILDQK
jgi:hypothetical protein